MCSCLELWLLDLVNLSDLNCTVMPGNRVLLAMRFLDALKSCTIWMDEALRDLQETLYSLGTLIFAGLLVPQTPPEGRNASFLTSYIIKEAALVILL